MIDEILRNQIGIDFETAAAKQQYIGQLLETTKGGALSMQLKINRCLLRQRIVACAQRVWARAAVNENDREDATDGTSRKRLLATQMMVLARERWGPTALLPTFLFPARSLCTSKFLYPYDDKARWLPDPTHTLQTSRDVLRAGPDWIGQKATEMLEGLLVHRAGDAVTAWTEAAEKWHYQRLKNDLYMGKYLNFGYGGARLRELTDQTSKDINRLDVIAKKLRIDPLFPVGSLTDQEKRMAVASFNKILQHRCGGCPLHNFLIVPLGLAQVVQHHREHHPLDFWLNDNWMIRG